MQWGHARGARLDGNLFQSEQQHRWPEQIDKLSGQQQRAQRRTWGRATGGHAQSEMSDEHRAARCKYEVPELTE
ncbi:hypothetical protein [Rhodothermus marinus]|uniref:hypothetical protein n=1 Tax=Rhodothermus marinus TaxID=29549 RepID=UPI001FB32922|nr:hypothetical protein [Rhodothermus marinus]